MIAENKKVVLVTGASSGMGQDFVKALLKEGMVVYGVSRRVESMNNLKTLGAKILKLDITKTEDIEAVIKHIKKESGGVDVLINNAGFGMFGAVEDISIEDARYQFEVNLFGLALLTKLVLPSMRNKKAGKIINISSVAGRVYFPLGAWYNATKYALEGWSNCLHIEVKNFGIDVIIIEPGLIKTEFGNIANDYLLKNSCNGAYADIANKILNFNKESNKRKDYASPPQVITDLVLKAVKSKKPKIRYVGGKYAKSVLFIKKWLGDGFYNKFISSMLK